LHVDLTDEDVIARFRREALIATKLDHPNIVRVDDYNVTEDGTPYLVLEYLEGESLAQRLVAGPLPLEKVESIVRMVGSAIAAAHAQGIVHRDLKPQNIFLLTTEIDGSLVEVAKVLDFGISKMRGGDTIKTQESTLLGTPQYMAPEQATGQHASVDERTDVFALGAIVYEMLTGRPAFSGENIPEVVFKVVYEQPSPLGEAVPGLPANIVAAVEKAMSKQANDRFSTVAEFVEALTGRPLAQRQTSMISIPPRDPATPTTGKRSGQAAFANTIDSGNVSKSAAAVPVAPSKPVPVISPHAETMVSQDGHQRSPTAPPVEARPKGLVIVLGVACLLAVAVAIFFGVRSHGDRKKIASITHDAAAPMVEVDAQEIDAQEIDAHEIDATVPVDAGVPPDAAKVVKAAGGTINRSEGEATIWADIDKAEAALKTGDTELANRLANTVINNSKATATQESLAFVTRGVVHCKAQSIGLANGDLRQIKVGFLKQRLVKRCWDEAKFKLE